MLAKITCSFWHPCLVPSKEIAIPEKLVCSHFGSQKQTIPHDISRTLSTRAQNVVPLDISKLVFFSPLVNLINSLNSKTLSLCSALIYASGSSLIETIYCTARRMLLLLQRFMTKNILPPKVVVLERSGEGRKSK